MSGLNFSARKGFPLLLLLLLLAFLCGSSVAEYKKSSAVAELSNTDFYEFIAEKPAAIVFFYAPWCPHCTRLADEFALAAEELEERGIAAARVNAGREENRLMVAADAKVYLVPHYKLYFNGGGVISHHGTDYEGPRDSSGLVAWVEEATRKAGVKIEPKANRPPCGSIETVQNRVGNGGHNGICQTKGAISFGLCKQKLSDTRECSALTYKSGECYLHDRHSSDHWSDEEKGGVYAIKRTSDLDRCR